MTPDMINAIFELCGSLAIAFSVKKIYNDKLVRGVSWLHVAFFMSWGWWNLYFYPSVDAWASFYAGILLTVVNTIYLSQLIYYTLKEKNGHRAEDPQESDRGWGV